MRRVIRIGVMLAALLGSGAAGAAAEGYAEGQVWEYRTRPGDEGSLLRIGRIEPLPGDAAGSLVYHISVAGVRLGEHAPTGIVQHLPVAKETLDASVTRRSERSADFGAVEEGMAEWRRAEGGVFNIPLADIVEALVQTLGNGTRRPE